MSAEEYYKHTTQQEITGELRGVIMYNWYSLIHFADEYHKHETKQHKTELLSAGSYDQLEMKQDEKDVLFKILFELRKDVNELKTNPKNY